MPVVTGLFRRVDRAEVPPMVPDRRTRPALEAYVLRSRATDAHLNRVIDDLVVSQEPILIWGVGTHTRRLLATSRLREARIVAFVDSNRRYQGRELAGIPIRGPEEIRDLPYRIVVSSRVFQREIARQIREAMGLTQGLVLLYRDCD